MIRPVAIVGAKRTPFARSGGAYAELSNHTLLSSALTGLCQHYALEGVKIDEVFAGAVTTHSRDWNLAREAMLSTPFSPLSPAVTLQQACGTSLQGAMIAAAKIASGQIECAIAAGSDTTSDVPLVLQPKLAKRLLRARRLRGLRQRLAAFKGLSLSEFLPQPPSAQEPRTLLSMGQHAERMAQAWSISRQAQDQLALESHQRATAAYRRGFYDPQLVFTHGLAQDDNLRPDSSLEALARLKPVFDRSERGTLSAGNSTTLTDGAACVLLASEAWAKAHQLPVLAYLTHTRAAAVDFIADEGLLMAPVVAVSELLEQADLSLQDFDFYELHEAFAAQVLCTLAAWDNERYCRERLGRDLPLGTLDRQKLNVVGSSLALGHPFAATGARVLATLAALLEQQGQGRGLISVCTAGGMGLSAVLER